MSMSVLNSHLVLSVTELESMPSVILLNLHLMLSVTGFESELESMPSGFYYIAELTLDVERDWVGERVPLYIADQAGIVAPAVAPHSLEH
jgi:hypothetical protein